MGGDLLAQAAPALKVRKRDGSDADFDRTRIQHAIENAFRAEFGLGKQEPIANEIGQDALAIVDHVVQLASREDAKPMSVEQIQDAVEIELMRRSHFRVARRYILYRTEHARRRAIRHQDRELADLREDSTGGQAGLRIEIEPGQHVPFDARRLHHFLRRVVDDVHADTTAIAVDEVIDEVVRGSFDGMTTADLARALVLASRSRIECDPAYDQLAASLQLTILYRQTIRTTQLSESFERNYRDGFEHYIVSGIRNNRLCPDLRSFDLDQIAVALEPQRDRLFPYLGVQAIYDRYLLQIDGRRIETPQYFWMRVAMGLALAEHESERTNRAIEFYSLLSSLLFTSATPTLFNSGTPHPQLSSCYLTTVGDDLQQIFKGVGDNAVLSKWAGGLGNDWTNVRATGSIIRGTNGTSQGVIPFLKIVNDTAIAVNQGGKRKGAVCAYLEPWHLDFEEFLDLRKNTGDDRRRTHDMHTAAWIPDLFMQRLRDGGQWTLFSPDEVPDLHDCYGTKFRERYEHYEQMASAGKLTQSRTVSADYLWRKLLTRLFETGHPWVTFKDPSNIRSPQDHAGVVHSSNLCTEILLNTSADETAVCNLGSVNLAAHVTGGRLDVERLRSTIEVAMRMLDNVIDINFYPTDEARNANLRHRPVGLGIMGFSDALQRCGIDIASNEALEFSDTSMEAISYFAILASTQLAAARGRYASYEGSKWSRGLLPQDTLDLLEHERGEAVAVDRSQSMDWQVVRDAVARHGMRNSNCLAIAPTATISTIIGVNQSIEPTYKHLYAKSNLSGEFIQINKPLVESLKADGIWDADILDELKHYDGSIANIQRIPEATRKLFATAFEIEPRWLIEAAARRQKWIDQGQSLNLYLAEPSGKAIDAMYRLAWKQGLKTTYYLRSLAATQVEKSTVDVNRHGIQPRWMKSQSESAEIQIDRIVPQNACSTEDPDCEACQ